MTQVKEGAAPEAAPQAPAVAPAVPPEGTPPSPPEDGKVVFESQEEYDKALNAGRSDLGRVNADLKAQLDAKTAEIDGLRTTQEGIITTQRQAQLDAAKEDPAAQARLRETFAIEDGKAANTRRSSDLDARDRQLGVNATANSDITAQAKATELASSTGVPAQTLLDSPLVKDKAADGTEVYNLDKMASLAGTLKVATPGETKGVTAVGANTPAAIAAAANDTEFKRAWGEGELPNSKANQDRARALEKNLGV